MKKLWVRGEMYASWLGRGMAMFIEVSFLGNKQLRVQSSIAFLKVTFC